MLPPMRRMTIRVLLQACCNNSRACCSGHESGGAGHAVPVTVPLFVLIHWPTAPSPASAAGCRHMVSVGWHPLHSTVASSQHAWGILLGGKAWGRRRRKASACQSPQHLPATSELARCVNSAGQQLTTIWKVVYLQMSIALFGPSAPRRPNSGQCCCDQPGRERTMHHWAGRG
jgi:hypothetical protein